MFHEAHCIIPGANENECTLSAWLAFTGLKRMNIAFQRHHGVHGRRIACGRAGILASLERICNRDNNDTWLTSF